MTGTEKQIAWATDLRNMVNESVSGAIASIKSDARYEANKDQADKIISVWESRLEMLNACGNASKIIEFFGGIKSADFATIQSTYRFTPNNGYNFK